MPPAAISWSCTKAVLEKADARDKLARAVQFASRAIVGFTEKAAQSSACKESAVCLVNERARDMLVAFSMSRRIARFLRAFQFLPTIPASLALENPIDRILEVTQKLLISIFFFFDHIGWMKQMRLLPAKGEGLQRGILTIRFGLKFNTSAQICGSILEARRLLRIILAKPKTALLSNAEKEQEAVERRAELHRRLFWFARHTSMVAQVGYLGQWFVGSHFPSGDALCGSMGVISSLQDFAVLWPETSELEQP